MAHEQFDIVSMDQMQSVLDGEVRRERRAKSRNLILGLVLVVGVWWYLGWVYGNLGEVLDESGLASMLGDYTEAEMLPAARPLIKNFLLEDVPQGVDDMSKAAVAQLPQLRKEMLAAFAAPIDEELAKLDERLAEDLRVELIASRPRIERIIIGLPQEKQRDLMADQIAGEFRAFYSMHSREMVREFNSELALVEAKLRHILTAPPSTLTPDQLHRRQLILLGMATAQSTFAGEGAGFIEVLLNAIYKGLDKESL